MKLKTRLAYWICGWWQLICTIIGIATFCFISPNWYNLVFWFDEHGFEMTMDLEDIEQEAEK